MPSVEEVERLSRYLAGELSAEERREVESQLAVKKELQQALAALRHVELEAARLPPLLDDAAADRLVDRVARPAAASRGRSLRVASAAVLVACVLGALVAVQGGGSAHAVALGGGVEVDGRPLALGADRPLSSGSQVATGDSGMAVLGRAGRAVLLPRNSRARLVRPKEFDLALEAGAALVSGSELTVVAAGAEVTVRGRALLSVEPGFELGRVTDALDPTDREASMMRMIPWGRLGPVAAAAVAGSALTLVVMEGQATAAAEGHAPVTVREGQAWQSGDPAPKAVALAPQAPGPLSAAAPGRPEPLPTAAGATALSTWPKEKLVAEVERLRDEREQLLRQKHAPHPPAESAPADPAKDQNYYRLEPQELVKSAEKGELRLRLPHLHGEGLEYKSAARDDVGLRPDEEKALQDIYRRSQDRLRSGLVALYKEIGGDENIAGSLGLETLLQELRNKALPGDFARAIRRVARERAGLEATGNPAEGPAILRAYRLMRAEDDRVVDEVERLLGPARAERLLNHPETSHSDNVFGVGPEPAKR